MLNFLFFIFLIFVFIIIFGLMFVGKIVHTFLHLGRKVGEALLAVNNKKKLIKIPNQQKNRCLEMTKENM